MDEGTGTATADTATTDTGTTTDPDYKAMYEAATADADKWKGLSRKHEKQAKENADADKAAADRQAALDKVLAALGVEAGNKSPDVDAITSQLEAAKAAQRAHAVELAVLRAAGRAGADGDALLDSRAFLASLNGVDPTDTAAINDAIKAAITANPRYGSSAADTAGAATTQPAPQRQASSTGEFNGAPGGGRQWTDADVARATPAQLEAAIKAGLTAQLMAS